MALFCVHPGCGPFPELSGGHGLHPADPDSLLSGRPCPSGTAPGAGPLPDGRVPRISRCPRIAFCQHWQPCVPAAIFCSIIVQNIAQLKSMYKDSWESLVGLCDEFLYLGGNEQGTHKYVSELIGKETVETTSRSLSRGRSGSSSTSHQQAARDLMTPRRSAPAFQ